MFVREMFCCTAPSGITQFLQGARPSVEMMAPDGRAPWWNCVIPLGAVQQNIALTNMNNPDPTGTVRSVR